MYRRLLLMFSLFFILPSLLFGVEEETPDTKLSDSYSILPKKEHSIPKEVKRVLIINSYSPLYNWSNQILESIKESLSETAERRTELSIEYLSSEYFRDPMLWFKRFESIVNIYKDDKKPDVIVLISDEAWMCYRESDDGWLKNIPVVLCAVKPLSLSLKTFMENREFQPEDFEETATIIDREHITAILRNVNIEKDIDMIASIIPDVSEIAVITDVRFYGVYCKLKAKKYMDERYPQLKQRFFDARFVRTDSLLNSLNEFSPQTGILLSHWMTNEYSYDYFQENIYPLIGEAAHAPIVYTSQLGVDNPNFLGAYYFEGIEWGKPTANVIQEIIKGVPPNRIDIVTKIAMTPYANWKSVEKFDLSTDRFPPNTVFENKPLPIGEVYRTKIIWGSIVLGVIILFLIVSLFLNYKLNRARRLIQKQADDLGVTIAGRDKMYSVIAHDLRSPLSSIKMILDLLSATLTKEKIGEDMYEMLTTADKTTGDMFILLDNLLKWTKHQLGRLNVAKVQIDIAKQIEGTVALSNLIFQEKQVHVEFQSPESIEVNTDPDMVKTIIRNLISNAGKFSYEGGVVEVKLSESNECFVIQVRDHGCGISEENLRKILGRKETLTTFGTSNEEGSGLGLSLCFDFTKLLGGEYEIESKVGEGTTFRITLPK